ncbi:MAG: hypothetical protein HQK66_05415, partial [Desulfamplus sp.]|nr:hypothetical protein [Desulfamplus sp.]
MKKILFFTSLSVIFIMGTIYVPKAHAVGSKDRQLIKGIIIGTGAAIVGAAVINEINRSAPVRSHTSVITYTAPSTY